MSEQPYQRIIRVRQGQALPLGVRFLEYIGVEYDLLGTSDVVLVEDTIAKSRSGVVLQDEKPAAPPADPSNRIR